MTVKLTAAEAKRLGGATPKRKRGAAKQSETALVKQILEWLHLQGIFAWRNNTGAFAGEHNGKKRFVRFGIKGGSDIFGVLPDGVFLAIECKVGTNQLSEDQRTFIDTVNDNGGIAFPVWEFGDLEIEWDNWIKHDHCSKRI